MSRVRRGCASEIAIARDGSRAQAHYSRGRALAMQQRPLDALRAKPDHVGAMTDLSWILAGVQPRDRARADEAVALAERAAEPTKP